MALLPRRYHPSGAVLPAEAQGTAPKTLHPQVDNLAVLGLAAVVVAWLLRPQSVVSSSLQHDLTAVPTTALIQDAVAVMAFGVLCIRVLLCGQQQVSPVRSGPGPPTAADAVSYAPFRGTTVVPGGAPLPGPRSVADKLDDFVSVLDFIPSNLHAAIRSNQHLKQGNEDITQYVQAALDFVGVNVTKPRVGPIASRSAGTLHFPGGLYYISNLRINASVKLQGGYLNNTTLYAVPGTKGPMLQDKGDAAKITIQDLEIDGGQEPGVTAGIQMGCFTGKPGGSPWGTYAYLQNIMSRGIPNGCGIRLKVNVSTLYNGESGKPCARVHTRRPAVLGPAHR